VKFEGAYHGHHDYGLHGVTLSGSSPYPIAEPDSAGIPPEVSKTVLVAPFNDLAKTRRVIESYAADDVAAIIVEPIQRALTPASGFLSGLRDLCRQIGSLLVFDEVVTGFRLAMGGAQEAFGVKPDLCALGKIVGGGLPLAAVVGRRDIIELSVPDLAPNRKSVCISGTLNGNALAAAAGQATLHGLCEIAARLSIPFQMIGPPAFAEPIFGEGMITDYRSYAASNRAAAKAFGVELLKRGIFVHPASKLYVSTAHTEEQLDSTLEAALEAMRTIRDQGYLKESQ